MEKDLKIGIRIGLKYGVCRAALVAVLYNLIQSQKADPNEPKERIGWVRMTIKEWYKETTWCSERTLLRHLKTLEQDGLIKSKQFDKHHWDTAKWYTLNYENPLVWEAYGEGE